MKNIKSSLLSLIVFSCSTIVAQTVKKLDYDSIAKPIVATIFKELTHEVDSIKLNERVVLTGRGFNLLGANTMASYLSSSTDFTLSKAYAVLDNTDGRLYVAGNVPFKKKSKEIFGVLTLGAKSNVVSKIAELYNKEKLSNDISAEGKFTYLIFNSIKFGKYSQIGFGLEANGNNELKDKMSLVRSRILQEDRMKAQKEIAELRKSMEGINEGEIDEIMKDKAKSIKEDVADDFYKEEEAAFRKSPDKYSNSQKLMWLSVSGSVPISETKYSIAENYQTTPRDVKYYPISATGKITFLHDYYKYIKYFINLSYSLGKSNTLLDSAIDQSVITKTIKLDSTSSVNSTSKTYYSSTGYKQYATNKLRGQFIFYPFPKKNKYVGVDVFTDISLDSNKDKATWGLGMPVSLNDKDGKPLVNFEIIYDKINVPQKSIVRISLALPFSSIIY